MKLVSRIQRKNNRKKNNVIKQCIYETIWGETPPRKKRIVNKDKQPWEVISII